MTCPPGRFPAPGGGVCLTTTATFTRTNATHLAAKVIADLYQRSVLYGRPTEDAIDDYETELIELLANGYVDTYEFGFNEAASAS